MRAAGKRRAGEQLPLLVLVTGGRGAGKSRFLALLRDTARSRGLRCGGVLAPGVFGPGGEKRGILAEDAAGGERRPLAEAVGATAEPRDTGSVDEELRIGRFRFSARGFAWAEKTLLRALDAGVDLLLIDEAGPLELEERKGYYDVLLRLRGAGLPAAVAVRPSLLDRLRDLLPAAETITLDVAGLDGATAAARAADLVVRIERIEQAGKRRGNRL